MNVMSKSACIATVCASLFSMTALAQTAPATKQNSQQTRMTTCNAEAKTRNVQGDARKQFMKSCLSNDTTKDGKPLTSSQQRMADCNKEAKTKALAGDARKTFMSTCLKKS